MYEYEHLVHQISFLQEVLILKQNFQKSKVLIGKTPFLVKSHPICLNIGF